MSNPVRPHRRQPTRLPCPWDSPGKNTGVGCHFLLQWRKVKSKREVAQSCPTLSDPMDCSLQGSSIHGIFQARVLERGAIAFSVKLLAIRAISWRIPWAEEPGRLQSMQLQRVGHDWATKHSIAWGIRKGEVTAVCSLGGPMSRYKPLQSHPSHPVDIYL